jgi:DNA-binding CsgD family transcriptional regulator
MGVSELICSLEDSESVSDLQGKMQRAIETYGFGAFNFFDAGNAHLETPYYFGTTGEEWENEYRSNEFVKYDHTLSFARRTNVGFKWGDAPLPGQHGKRKPKAFKLLEAARDYGFEEGYILPFHFVDLQGRSHTALVALFWQDAAQKMEMNLSLARKHELELIMLYFVQRAVRLRSAELQKHNSFTSRPDTFSHLTDRERDVLTWAGRGRSAAETGEILGISQETVKTYLVQAMEKLEALNKTHAVAKAVHLGLIDL